MTKKEKARKPKPRSAKKLSDLEFSTVSDIPLGEADAGLGGMFTKSRLWNFWNSGTYSNRIKPEMEFIAEIKDLVNELSAQPFKPVTNLCNWSNESFGEHFCPTLRAASMVCGLDDEALRRLAAREPGIVAEMAKWFQAADYKFLVLAGLMMGARARLHAVSDTSQRKRGAAGVGRERMDAN